MKTRSRRPAYTLFEVVLVAGVLLLVAAFSVPSLKGMHGYYKLQGGVDAVRASFAQARSRAIEEGRPYRFAVEPNGNHYRIAPDRPDYWSGPASAGDGDGPALVLEQTLPAGVRFNLNGEPSNLPGPDVSDSAEKNTAASGEWSTAVVFLPDGTARDDVRIHFQVHGVRPMLLHLRGLTGTVTVQSVSR